MFNKHYARCYERFNQGKPYKREIQFVNKWADNPKRVLDIGCGTAHYWKYFPDDVYVVGLETSQEMIDLSPYKDQIFHGWAGYFKDFKVQFDCVTALFNVINYVKFHTWWGDMPLKSGGFFIFDIWDSEKVAAEGFKETEKEVDGIKRIITPTYQDKSLVEFEITFFEEGIRFIEHHAMKVYSHKDIETLCGSTFEIVEVRKRKTKWQTWYKLKKV